jgi:hypothetical protein
MEAMMQKLRLTVNRQKMRSCRAPEELFDFFYSLLEARIVPSSGESNTTNSGRIVR